MVTFFSGSTIKRTGGTGEVAAVGQLETGQERNLLPEDFPPNEKSGKLSEAVDGHHEEAYSVKTIGL